ncbi:MAG TPA: cupin domain-containing protein [Thermoplasmatales archaeon]|nr:cupin domain-containing protein [Thermoplasmatales archaeon]
MKVKHMHYTDIKAETPKEEGAENVTIRWLITKNDGAENFAMRLFELKKGGCSPWHQHDWEHEVFILDGKGKLVTEKGDEELKPGDFVFLPPMEWHQFKQDGEGVLKFLCLIPYKKNGQ